MNYFLADTKENIYWEEFLQPYKPKSEIGLEIWKAMKPFQAGDEDKWHVEIENITSWVSIIKDNSLLLSEIESLYDNFYDIRNLLDSIMVKRLINPLIDGFYLKQFLWFSYSLSNKINSALVKQDSILYSSVSKLIQLDWDEWLRMFQPNYNGIFYSNFALQDIDDSRLKLLREEKRKINIKARELEQQRKKMIEEKYSVMVNLERYLVVDQANTQVKELSRDQDLTFIRHQGEDFVFFLQYSSKEEIIRAESQRLNRILEDEETRRFNELVAVIEQYIPVWQEVLIEWGRLEVILKKAKLAIDINGAKPVLDNNKEPSFYVRDAFHPYLVELWKKDNSNIVRFTLEMEHGITVLYGANMSGKTIILRTIGLIQALAQYGFYVPARELHFNFVSHLTLMTGDYQDVEKGLSSFGSEISRLSQDLTITNNTLYLLDEIGTGTNPIEGEALAIAILRYLKNKNGALSLLVSHFPNLIQEEGLKLYEAKNYELNSVDKASMVFEGVSIAESLGLPSSIVNEARKYLDDLK